MNERVTSLWKPAAIGAVVFSALALFGGAAYAQQQGAEQTDTAQGAPNAQQEGQRQQVNPGTGDGERDCPDGQQEGNQGVEA